MNLIERARELGAEIQNSDVYTAYLVAKNAMEGDAALQEMIGDFNLKKISLSEAVADDNKDKEKIAALNQDVRDLYNKIMATPVMLALNTTRGELDRTLQFIQQIVVGSANGEDPMTIQEEEDCGGDCGGCSGCGGDHHHH